jgi:hypothetical protein
MQWWWNWFAAGRLLPGTSCRVEQRSFVHQASRQADLPHRHTLHTANHLEELQAVRIVVVGKIERSALCMLPRPKQSHCLETGVPLRNAARVHPRLLQSLLARVAV